MWLKQLKGNSLFLPVNHGGEGSAWCHKQRWLVTFHPHQEKLKW